MWFKIFLPVIFKSTISVSCLSNHGDNKFTSWLAHSPLLFACQNSTDRNWSPMLTTTWGHSYKSHISCWNTVSQAWHAVTNPGLCARTFGLDIGSSDSCRLCQFLRDSAVQTALSRRVADGFLWCTRVFISLSKQKWCHLGNPCIGIGHFIAFAIYLDWFYRMINSCFNFLMLDGGVYHGGNRQNLRKTKWRPFCWNSRFGTFDAPRGVLPCYNRD